MALLVGHGYPEERVLGLTLSCFDALVQCVLRVRRESLVEWARTAFLAAQCSGKDLEDWLALLTATRAEAGPKREKLATRDEVLGAMNGKSSRSRRG